MTAERPYVDRRVVDLDAAHAMAIASAADWNLAVPVLLRRGMNAIYACGDVVLRVGRASAPAASSHALVTMLLTAGVPATRPIEGLAVDRDGFAVTAWERIDGSDTPVDWEAVGAAVRIVHDLDTTAVPADYPVPSPSAFPWWDFDAMLADTAAHIDARPLAVIRSVIDEGRWWREAVDCDATLCHGDVHPGNVLVDDRRPLLIDWDLLCVAAPAWDHAMLTTYAERWGGSPGVYAAFASGYGSSLADDELTVTIARLRNVAATLMRVKAGLDEPTAMTEAKRRLRYWAGDLDAPVWSAQ